MDEKDLNPDERAKMIAKLRAMGVTGPVNVIGKSRTAEDIAASMLERVLDAPIEGTDVGEIKPLPGDAPDPRVAEFYEKVILPGFYANPLGKPWMDSNSLTDGLDYSQP